MRAGVSESELVSSASSQVWARTSRALRREGQDERGYQDQGVFFLSIKHLKTTDGTAGNIRPMGPE